MALIDVDGYWKVRRILGGACGASWRGVPYVRMRPSCCNSNRARQQQSRAIASTVQRYWKVGLTDEQRATWDDLAGYWYWWSALEWRRALSGQAWFFCTQTRVLRAGWEIQEWGDEGMFGRSFATAAVAFVDGKHVSVTFDPDEENWNAVCVWWSGSLRPGQDVAYEVPAMYQFTVWSGWRWVGVGELGGASPQVLELPEYVGVGGRAQFLVVGMSFSGDYGWEWMKCEAVRE